MKKTEHCKEDFQKIDVNEPSVEETYQILFGLRKKYEDFHKVKYSDKAIKAAVDLSSKYIGNKKLPDKAIDIIDELGAFESLKQLNKKKQTLDELDVEGIVAKITKIPKKTITLQDQEYYKELPKNLKRLIYGQGDHAIESLSSAIKLSRSGLRESSKTIGNYLFGSPTGVGKTELAKQLSIILGVELIRFDMSEFSEKHTIQN